MTITFKTNCPECGGKHKIKTKATYNGTAWVVAPSKCHKCGHKLPGFTL